MLKFKYAAFSIILTATILIGCKINELEINDLEVNFEKIRTSEGYLTGSESGGAKRWNLSSYNIQEYNPYDGSLRRVQISDCNFDNFIAFHSYPSNVYTEFEGDTNCVNELNEVVESGVWHVQLIDNQELNLDIDVKNSSGSTDALHIFGDFGIQKIQITMLTEEFLSIDVHYRFFVNGQEVTYKNVYTFVP